MSDPIYSKEWALDCIREALDERRSVEVACYETDLGEMRFDVFCTQTLDERKKHENYMPWDSGLENE